MPKNSNNLVPTRIVNKNGVSTTVYRKSSGTGTAASRIPSPSASTTKKNNAELINARLTKLPHISDETMLNASRSFFDKGLGELSQRLLTTGTATGQRLAAESLSFWVGRVAERMHETGQKSIPSTPHSGNLIEGEIVRKWNYGNVCEEAGLPTETISDEDHKGLKYAHSMVTAGVSIFDKIPEESFYTMPKELESYWRGVAAISLCFDFQDESEESDNEWQNFDAFIPWAAEHDDIETVINVAKKHNTLDPERLERLIEAKDHGVHDSTVEGWL